MTLSHEMMGIIGLIVVIALMFLKVPLGISFAIVGGIGIWLLASLGASMGKFATVPYAWTTTYSFSCLPMFVLMGIMVAETGIAKDLYSSAHKWLGNMPGGLAMTTLIVTAFFSAVSGSAVAAAATIALTCYPEMKRYNYDPGLASGVIAAGSTMDIMIPPSIPMIIYAMVAEVSVGRMFMAGFAPGVIEVIIFALIIYTLVKRKPSLAPRSGISYPFIEKVKGLKSVAPSLIVFVAVFGGMYLGIFTPTEAGAIGVAAVAIVCLVMRRLTWTAFKNAVFQTVRLTGQVLMLLIGVMFFNTFIALSGVSTALSDWVVGMGVSATAFMVIILVLYLLIGAIMDELSMMLLTLPIFLPAARALGIDPIMFGILIIIAWQLGSICPPVGLVAFVTKSVLKDVSLETIYKGCLPFIGGLVLVEILIVFIPNIVLGPEKLLMGG